MMEKVPRLLMNAVLVLCCFLPSLGHAEGRVYSLKDYKDGAAFLESIPLPGGRDSRARRDLTALFSAYPDHCAGIELSEENRLYVVMNKGRRLVYEDGKGKSFREKLEDPDLQDMLEQEYRPGPVEEDPPEDFDPGRIRVTAFFQAVYGETRDEVVGNCLETPFLGERVPFNVRGGARDALRKVDEELSALLRANPPLAKHVRPLGGSFSWRWIDGTRRLSPHAFAAALDLNPARGAYWRWGTGTDPGEARRRYPREIVRAFEKHGFIWGGKWYHYDLMHFEFRPELLFSHRISAEAPKPAPWAPRRQSRASNEQSRPGKETPGSWKIED
ncbi:MAG TPA: M15 family metallopeptidase [Syntrophobacteraceae bacterium]|nr:M15 family metallopeptidase [Syntrophobacteraceae bacterium]